METTTTPRRQTFAERTKAVKATLAAVYGFKNVTCKGGRGTARAWVEARVCIDRPADCHCSQDERHIGRCRSCRQAKDSAEKFARTRIRGAGVEFSTYTSDDGFGSEHDCFLLDIKIKEN